MLCCDEVAWLICLEVIKLLVHEKAGPTMMRVYHNTDHEGTARELRQEVPNSTCRKISATINPAVSHSGCLPASLQCRLSQKTAAMGTSSGECSLTNSQVDLFAAMPGLGEFATAPETGRQYVFQPNPCVRQIHAGEFFRAVRL